MTEAERNEKRMLQAKKARRKHRLLVGSSWSLVLTAFTGFFVLWNHLGATPVHAAVSQTGTTSSSTTATPTRHHHNDDFGDGSQSGDDGSSSGSFASSGSSSSQASSASSGSATVIPSQGSDFSSSAS